MSTIIGEPWTHNGQRCQIVTAALPGETQLQHQTRHDQAEAYMRSPT